MHKLQSKNLHIEDTDDFNQERTPKIINNIFISNININLNLNINISIPPSPKSTRNNNQSVIDSFHSEIANLVKHSDHDHNSQLHFEVYQDDAPYADQIKTKRIGYDQHEDLSLVDDEMPLQ